MTIKYIDPKPGIILIDGIRYHYAPVGYSNINVTVNVMLMAGSHKGAVVGHHILPRQMPTDVTFTMDGCKFRIEEYAEVLRR